MNETTEIVKRKGDNVIVKYGHGYCVTGTALKLKNTGNGYIAKFPAAGSVNQDYYVCLDYGRAELMYLALKEVFENGSR